MAVSTLRQSVDAVRRDRTRQKLLNAAARVIGEFGAAKATIDDFIQSAQVSRGTFYNYYPAKTALMDDLWQTVGRDPFEAIQASCAHIADPGRRLGMQVRLILSCARVNPTWGWLVFVLSADAESVNSDLLSFPRPVLMEGKATGRLNFSSQKSAADVVVGTVRRGLNATLSEEADQRYADELSCLILCAMGIESAEAEQIASEPLSMTFE